MKTSDEFILKSKQIVKDCYTDDADITIDNVYVVWYAKILQNFKGLFATDKPDDMYYEITFNGDKEEIYVDAYKKWENFIVKE